MDTSYFSQVRTEIEPLLPAQVGTVMEIGCGQGGTLRWLREHHGARRTIGIEISPEAAECARTHVDEVHVADVGAASHVLAARRGTVQLLLLLDVLEHLREPLQALTGLKDVLSSEGIVIASIPNVRSIKVLGPLVFRGDFRYRESGILDRTHLVFFTKKTVIELFTAAGFDCLAVRGNGALRLADAKTLSGWGTALFNRLSFGAFEGFLANQWLVCARKAKAGGATA